MYIRLVEESLFKRRLTFMSNFKAIIERKSFSKQKERTKVIIEAESKEKARNMVYRSPEFIEFISAGGLYRLKIMELQ